jgi:hypothetical protein
LRIPDHQAKQYEENLHHGAVIISVHTQSEKELESAMQILADAGAEDLHKVQPAAPVIQELGRRGGCASVSTRIRPPRRSSSLKSPCRTG